MYNKLYLIIQALVLLTFFSCNENSIVERNEIDLDSIAILPHWENDIKVYLEMKKTKKVNRKEYVVHSAWDDVASVSEIEVHLSKNKDNTWNGKWTIKKVKAPAMANFIEKQLESMIEGFSYNFTLDSSGAFIELINWQEVQAKVQKTLALVLDEIKKHPSTSPEMLSQISASVAEMFNTKERIEAYLMQEVRLYFTLGGVEMYKGEIAEGLAYVENPFTGGLVPLKVKSVYQKAYSDSTCDIEVVQSIEELDLYDVTKGVISKIAGEAHAEKFENEMENTSFDAKVTNNFNVSLATGLVERVIAKKEITVGETRRIDTIEIIKK